MNILGISGSIGWDGNIPYVLGDAGDPWIHGSGATLVMDGELKNAINEERFSRIKYDGSYPKLVIQNILEYNKLTKHDIDLVVYVCAAPMINFQLKMSGYIENKLQEYFPNSTVDFLPHHIAHASATFYTSGFDEANILTFDGAGDPELQEDGQWLIPHMKFLHGKDLTLSEINSYHCGVLPMHTGFGNLYNMYSAQVYKNKMNLVEDNKELEPVNRETYPGKVMGLSAFGDYRNINLPEWFSLEREKQRYSNEEWEDCLPQLHNITLPMQEWTALFDGTLTEIFSENHTKINPDDLAAWLQHQFEKYLLLFLSNIPSHIKHDNLCLGGGSALNILANSKIIEEGIYKNVHVNTAPNDDGLHFGAALYKSAEKEHKITLPEDIGYLGITYTDKDIEAVL